MGIGVTGLRAAAILAVACAAAVPADAPLVPLTVCEVARNLSSLDGASVAALGRYSFRAEGRWLDEQACDPAAASPPRLRLVEDAEGGPKPAGNLELDGSAVRRKLAEVQKRTSLGKFRFGSSDYDRWAVAFGRVEAGAGGEAGGAGPALVFRGSGVLVFLTPE
jgi:hypothetical protein